MGIERPRWSREVLHSHAVRIDPRPERTAKGWLVRCPCHDDHDPSLSLWLDGGNELHIHCFAGCRFTDLHRTLRDSYAFPEMVLRHGAEPAPDGPAYGAGRGGRTALASTPAPRVHERWAGAQPIETGTRLGLRHFQLGAPAAYWIFRTVDAQSMLAACVRYEPNGARRAYRYWSWWWAEFKGHGTQPSRWRLQLRCRMPPVPRPLYALPRLAGAPHAPVWVLEGARKAERAQAIAPDVATTSWMGGTNAVRHADWTPLAGRHVVMLPDADPAGWRAANAVRRALAPIAAEITIIDLWNALPALPGEAPRRKGWDVAKPEWTPAQRSAFAQWRSALPQGHPMAPRTPGAPGQ